MTVTTSTRLSLPAPDTNEDVAVPADIQALRNALDPITVAFDSGPVSGRQEQSPGAPGTEGLLYWATDDGTVSYSTGIGWLQVYPAVISDNAIVAAKIASSAVTAAKIAAGAVETDKIADLAVTAAKIANATITASKLVTGLKPSEGAGASDEALRALGTGAGRAAAGTHASQHGAAGADKLYTVGTISGTTDGAGHLYATVAHGLGTTPSQAMVCAWGGPQHMAPEVTGFDATNVNLHLIHTAAGVTVSARWIAFR